MNRMAVGVGATALAAAGIAAWWGLTPSRLGLAKPRLVIVSGEATVEGQRARATLPLATGATILTGGASAVCFSVHASRACLGASTQARLTGLAEHSGALALDHGTAVVSSAGEALELTVGDASVTVRSGLVAIEGAPAAATVRVLDGTATVTLPGAPPTERSPGATGLRDGAPRPASPAAAAEERAMTMLAGRWQGSAGATLELTTPGRRATVDGADTGRTPLSALLDEGQHTFVEREGPREIARETLELAAGQKVTRP